MVLYVMAHSHSVADDQPFHHDETFSDPFVMLGSPGSASVSSSSEDQNVNKQAAALLPVYSGSGSSSTITGKKQNVSQTRGRSIQFGEMNCSVKRAQRQHGGSTGSRIQQGIWNAGTGSEQHDVDDFEWNDNCRIYPEFPDTGTSRTFYMLA